MIGSGDKGGSVSLHAPFQRRDLQVQLLLRQPLPVAAVELVSYHAMLSTCGCAASNCMQQGRWPHSSAMNVRPGVQQ